ncbi:hypothetical protein EVAR_31142_1 [Eumeta japonica]|uniref:Uncharacterized protein n=1 Tax=Eumeta variegata TaxID=151549 RepID=A0A4C1VEB7_EUMVA|nr:hypothetical protein EVAR_31142_1 [Eumeta japonica]
METWKMRGEITLQNCPRADKKKATFYVMALTLHAKNADKTFVDVVHTGGDSRQKPLGRGQMSFSGIGEQSGGTKLRATAARRAHIAYRRLAGAGAGAMEQTDTPHEYECSVHPSVFYLLATLLLTRSF